MEPKEVVFVLGGPGSGKGTHCAKIASEFGYTHLSTGDLLREEQKKESDLASKIDDCIRDGLLVPSSIMVALLKEAIVNGEKERFLIDGFPRSKDNLEAWFQAFSDDEVQVKFVLFLHCPKEELTKRLLERGKTSGRADDNIDSVLKRFDTFENESLPVVEQLEALGMVRKVSTVPSRELVYHRVRRFFRGCRLVDPVSRTLALIKPDAVGGGKTDEIIARAEEEGFVIVARSEGKTWTKGDAEEFYGEHKGKAFFDDLVGFMSGGPVVQLCLEKVDAIKAWRKLAGPTDSTNAKASDPTSLRALFGTDGTKNAVHGSDSFASALREIGICFGNSTTLKSGGVGEGEGGREKGEQEGEGERRRGGDFVQEQKTLALLKPGVSELHSDDILSVLAFRGFSVLKTSTLVLTEEDASANLREQFGDAWFQELCESTAGRGEVTAMCLARIGAVSSWMLLAGPPDPAKAKEQSAKSLRAMYGEDILKNAVHASDSLECAHRELELWFGSGNKATKNGDINADITNNAGPGGEGVPAAVGPGDPQYDELMSYMKEKVDPVISSLLQRVLKARPEDVATFAAQDLQQRHSGS